MKIYDIMVYPAKYKSKITALKYTGAIKNNILNYHKQMTIQDIAKTSTDGHTIILGLAMYSEKELIKIKTNKEKIGASAKHWVKQQIYAIDFDNETMYKNSKIIFTDDKYFTVEKAIEYCKTNDIIPAFGYYTDSHTDSHNRFRLVFVLDKEITTLEDHKKIISALFNLFSVNGECVLDTKCCDPCRLFYSGKLLAYKNYDSVVNTEKLIKQFGNPLSNDNQLKTIKSQFNSLVANKFNSTKRIELIKNWDIEGLRASFINDTKGQKTQYLSALNDIILNAKQEPIVYILRYTCFAFSPAPKKPLVMRFFDDYYSTIKLFPLHFFLGLPFLSNINCILPNHHDKTPSARIERKDTGEYVYHCYGCNKRLDIFDIVERLCNCDHLRAKMFINELFNIRFETEWQIQKKAELAEYQDYVCTSEQLKLNFPVLFKKLKRAKALSTLNLLLQLAKYYLFDRNVTKTNKPLFYMALSLIAKKSEDLGIPIKILTLHKRIKFLSRLGLIIPVKDEELKPDFRDVLKKKKIEQDKQYRMNCFIFPTFTMKLLKDASKKIKKEENKCIRRRYYCRDAEIVANGIESANKIFVHSNKDISQKTERFFSVYKRTVDNLLTQKGWTNEKEILKTIRRYSKKDKERLSSICLPKLLEELRLKKIPYTKNIEQKFNIAPKIMAYGVSRIIITESDFKTLNNN